MSKMGRTTQISDSVIQVQSYDPQLIMHKNERHKLSEIKL